MHNPNPTSTSSSNSNSNSSSNIELSSQYLNEDPNSTSSGPQNPDYLPQVDLDTSSEDPQLQTSHYSIWYKLSRNKAINLPILFILSLYMIDMIPACGGFFQFFRNIGPILRMQDKMPNVLQYMSADLAADPIMDIKIMDEGSTCPSDFEVVNLGTWPGTVAGCLCDDGYLFKMSCETIKYPGCEKDIPANPPIEMYEWDDSIWCLKRAVLGKDYLKKAVCPSGYKECYPGGCFTGDCPITKLEITSTGDIPHKSNNSDKEGRYLTLTRAPGEPPLINIQITFGDIPCFIQDLFAQTIKNSTYKLAAIKKDTCDKYGLDTHSSKILATQTAYSSFEQNSFPYDIMHLPYFDTESIATRSILSSKTRMKTAKHDYCQDINDENMNKYFEVINEYMEVFRFMGWGGIMYTRIMCISIILIYRAKRWVVELFENAPELMTVLYIINFIFSFVVMALLVSFKSIYLASQTAKGYFEEYKVLGCFIEGQGNMVIDDYLENLRPIGSGFWIYWVLLVSNLLSSLMCLWLYIVKKKLAQENPTL